MTSEPKPGVFPPRLTVVFSPGGLPDAWVYDENLLGDVYLSRAEHTHLTSALEERIKELETKLRELEYRYSLEKRCHNLTAEGEEKLEEQLAAERERSAKLEAKLAWSEALRDL